ncbi:hypothetical protein L7F22_055407 [Adiantum nelumboides]|nr:hypothetical protein [Adiantum nelumboides]
MAGWADEFDIDDSDILGAANIRRKTPSQLASPPWSLAAAAGPRPSPLPLTSSAVDPHHSSASLLKRFQRPRSSQNGPSLTQNFASTTLDTQRKRKHGVDSDSPLLLKTARKQGRQLDDAICREDLSSSFRECVSQIKYGHRLESQEQGVNDGAPTCNAISTVEEHCHSLSSHGKSSNPAEGDISRFYLKNVYSQSPFRREDSQQQLKDMLQNVPLGNTVAVDAHQSVKPKSNLSNLQQKRPCTVQLPENGGDARSKQLASVTQQDYNLDNRPKIMHENISDQLHAPVSMRKLVPENPLVSGNRRESRGVRFLQKDLHYHIPGPAGVVQRSLGETGTSLPDNNRMGKNSVPSRPTVVYDTDFESGAWLKAKNYLEKSSIQVSTISSLKTSRTENRVVKLLAVIKSCVPNGCGDALVNLKDQTDSIHGTVNRRVLSETEFGRIMEPGAVILLHQVAVFSPTPYAHYLNITVNNVEQVFAKEIQFFRGECSRAASKAALDTTEGGLMEDVDTCPARCKSRVEELCAQKRREKAHSEIDQLLEEEDELEILLTRSAQRAIQEPVRDELEEPANAIRSGRTRLSDSPMKDRIDELHSNSNSDGYDQLLDDISIFT